MKKVISLLMVVCLIAISFYSCSQKETNDGESKMDKINQTKDMILKAAAKQNKGEEPKIGNPHSIEEIKAWLPTQYKEYRLDPDSFIENGEDSRISMTYRVPDDPKKSIYLEFMDGAGNLGPAVFALLEMKLGKEYEESNAQGYIKVYERKGVKVFQKEMLQSGSSMLEFALDNRFYFIISGEKTTAEELWGFTELLDPSKI